MISLHWVKDTADQWLPFQTFDINSVPSWDAGVYVIWHSGQPGRVVKVGQGVIRDRLTAHRNDPAISGYSARGQMGVTWATVPAAQRDGVERYLGDYYKPLAGDRFPDVAPMVANLPF
jgi:hypothetical protein